MYLIILQRFLCYFLQIKIYVNSNSHFAPKSDAKVLYYFPLCKLLQRIIHSFSKSSILVVFVIRNSYSYLPKVTIL